MNIINLTPHAICIKNSNMDVTVQPSGTVARVTVSMEESSPLLGGILPVFTRFTGEVDFGGMEATTDETIFIVSSMVLDALSEEHPMAKFCFAPDTGPSASRNDKGHILSVCQLIGK